jgi:hypothetical protein
MRKNDKVWYACYGSNLSSERFSYYIEGGFCPLNNKNYDGCKDKTLWTESKICQKPGSMYFARTSDSWGGYGVAFYDPEANGTVIMRLYKVTWGQLLDIQKQEGNHPHWYGWLVSLGVDPDGCPVYTITSTRKEAINHPSEKYLNLIRDALINECGFDDSAADKYLEAALNYTH